MTNHRILNSAVLLCHSDDVVQFGFEAAIARRRRSASFEAKRGHCDSPTIVQATNNVLFRTTRIGKEHLSKFCRAIDLLDRANLNTWLNYQLTGARYQNVSRE